MELNPALPMDLWGTCADQNLKVEKHILEGLTDEQKEIVLRPFPGRESSLVVQAYAGTGKTHTLQAFAQARPKEKIHYLAFNKSMAMEAGHKFHGMRNVKVGTIHSLAYQEIGKKFRDRLGDVNPSILTPIIRYYMPRMPLYKATSLLKTWYNKFLGSKEPTTQKFFSRNVLSAHEKTLQENDVSLDALTGAVEALWLNVVKGDGMCGPLPMSHDAYLKLYQLSGKQLGSKYILIDEAQDVTDCMIDIVQNQNAHKIFIGDSFQQIYAWNGAVDSLKKLEKSGSQVLYLTKSFRCPDKVATIADKYLRLLGAKKTFRGNGTDGKDDGAYCILARSNVALFREAWNCVQDKHSIAFMGGFEGYDFEILIDLQKALFGKFSDIRNDWLRNEFNSFDEILEYAEEDPHLMARCNLVRQYRGKIVDMYIRIKKAQNISAANADAILSTTHKAKGAEWGRVFLCDDFVNIVKINDELKDTDTPKLVRREDLNLLYVAVTRSKSSLDCPPQYDVPDDEMLQFKENIKNGRVILIN